MFPSTNPMIVAACVFEKRFRHDIFLCRNSMTFLFSRVAVKKWSFELTKPYATIKTTTINNPKHVNSYIEYRSSVLKITNEYTWRQCINMFKCEAEQKGLLFSDFVLHSQPSDLYMLSIHKTEAIVQKIMSQCVVGSKASYPLIHFFTNTNHVSGGQNYFPLAMDMAKVGGPVVKVCTSMLCVNIVYR